MVMIVVTGSFMQSGSNKKAPFSQGAFLLQRISYIRSNCKNSHSIAKRIFMLHVPLVDITPVIYVIDLHMTPPVSNMFVMRYCNMSVTRRNLSGIGLLRVAAATLLCLTKGVD